MQVGLPKGKEEGKQESLQKGGMKKNNYC